MVVVLLLLVVVVLVLVMAVVVVAVLVLVVLLVAVLVVLAMSCDLVSPPSPLFLRVVGEWHISCTREEANSFEKMRA